MLNTPGGLPSRARGGSIAEESASGTPEEVQGSLGSEDAGPAKQLGDLDEENEPQHIEIVDQSTNQDIRYDCNSRGRKSNRSPNRHARPETRKIAASRGSKGSLSSVTTRTSSSTSCLSISSSSTCSPTPPVTKATLSELDVPRIVFNPKLRHDVNFDPDLHFRPNLDGDSGRRKSQKATEFWKCLQKQLEAFMEDQVAFEAEFAGREWCLQSTLRAIAEILGTLVPPEDRSAVEEILNVELLMQQFRKGVADLEKLALWLSRTLKSHCAPMRDNWVDEMVNQLSIGNRNRDVGMLVQGLQTLLGVLEAMKLVSRGQT